MHPPCQLCSVGASLASRRHRYSVLPDAAMYRAQRSAAPGTLTAGARNRVGRETRHSSADPSAGLPTWERTDERSSRDRKRRSAQLGLPPEPTFGPRLAGARQPSARRRWVPRPAQVRRRRRSNSWSGARRLGAVQHGLDGSATGPRARIRPPLQPRRATQRNRRVAYRIPMHTTCRRDDVESRSLPCPATVRVMHFATPDPALCNARDSCELQFRSLHLACLRDVVPREAAEFSTSP